MHEQLEIRQQMSEVRNRGTAHVRLLADRVEKLSDWREHVRAHPVPIALAAAVAAYWLVPSKPRPSGTGTVASAKETGTDESPAKASTRASMTGAAMGFVGTLLANAIRNYISEQLNSLVSTSRGNHAAPQQRQTPFF